MTPADAMPDMEYAHPGAPDRYKALPATHGDYDLRTVEQRRQDEIAALTRQASRISQLTITLAGDVRRLSTEIAELRARVDRQEATD